MRERTRHPVPFAIALGVLISQAAMAQFPIPYHASYAVDAASNTDGLAPGAMFIVKGYFPARLVWAGLPLRKAVEGYGVTLTPAGGGAAVEAWMVYTHWQQMAAVLPSSTAPGSYEVAVKTPTETLKARDPARVIRRKYRSFTNNQEGWGLAVAQNFVSATRVDRNMFVAGRLRDGQTKGPASPGQTVILWGTGLGAVELPDETSPGRPLDLRGQADVRVAVGGVEADVTYAGRSPEFPGIDQINFVVPAGSVTGCNIALEVWVDGQPANPATLAMARQGQTACEHALFTSEGLELFDQGSAPGPGETDRREAGEFVLRTGSYSLNYQGQDTYAHYSLILGSFRRWNAAEVSRPDFGSVAPGRCIAWRGSAEGQPLTLVKAFDDSADAGRVTLSGPGRPTLPLDGDDDYYYRMMGVRLDDGRILIGPESYPVVPGTYTLRGAGGTDLAGFEAALPVPALLEWTNREEAGELDLARGMAFRWRGGQAGDRVVVQGGGPTYGTAANRALEVTMFFCVPPAGATSFTVPPSVLRGLAPTAQGLLEVTASGAGTGFRVGVVGSEKSIPAGIGYEMTRRRTAVFR